MHAGCAWASLIALVAPGWPSSHTHALVARLGRALINAGLTREGLLRARLTGGKSSVGRVGRRGRKMREERCVRERRKIKFFIFLTFGFSKSEIIAFLVFQKNFHFLDVLSHIFDF